MDLKSSAVLAHPAAQDDIGTASTDPLTTTTLTDAALAIA
jgi:hypothetical protein